MSENKSLLTLYHNTSNSNAIKIAKEGIKCGMRLHAYGKGSEAEGAGVWCTNVRGYGYGGATITFQISDTDDAIWVANDTEYIIYRDIKLDEIIDIDLVVSTIPSNPNRKDNINTTVESDIPDAINYYGKDKVIDVLDKNARYYALPYNTEQLKHLIETGEKYCMNSINKSNLTEAKQILSEASRNELLALTKGETITRYNKAAGYKGFSVVDINTSNILRDNTLLITCRVGDYHDVVELQDILYWVQIVAEQNQYNQVNTKGVTQAIMNSIDGMDIKVDCECADWKYRFAYQATVLGYKYGKPENRPNQYKRTNKDNVGALCKHLTSLLSNKRWLQQVTGKVMDFIEENIEKVNAFLRVKEGQELTLPNDLARQNAKLSWQNRRARAEKEKEEREKEELENEVVDNNEEINNTPQDINKPEETSIQEPNNNEEEETDNDKQ